MSAPEFVPAKPAPVRSKYYSSPPRLRGSWEAGRPGELDGPQPRGDALGSQGPDQGFAITIANRMQDQVHMAQGERWEDVRTGCVAVALKRASIFTRAPSAHDLRIAFTAWGFLDENPHADLVAARKPLFERVDNPHHYLELRAVAAAVSESTLRKTPDAIASIHKNDWEALLELPTGAAH